eukprot:TRINITY_DN2020_c0_g1_i1.p1 TRINITY_DN2020_c0_g1~~TRINITY_DN2020_c0_g1_i1.p1  ORF type:complete len:118 (+),score=10.16 TRINITY_DN2020_c0_g1_i1:446-799(+)
MLIAYNQLKINSLSRRSSLIPIDQIQTTFYNLHKSPKTNLELSSLFEKSSTQAKEGWSRSFVGRATVFIFVYLYNKHLACTNIINFANLNVINFWFLKKKSTDCVAARLRLPRHTRG